MTIAEILEEGERLEAEAATCQCSGNNPNCLRMRDGFARQHFVTLLAVAKAAVEWRRWGTFHDQPCGCADCVLMRAIDAAVRGEGKETTNG